MSAQMSAQMHKCELEVPKNYLHSKHMLMTFIFDPMHKTCAYSQRLSFEKLQVLSTLEKHGGLLELTNWLFNWCYLNLVIFDHYVTTLVWFGQGL